jgi:hypothetical protein
MRHFFSKIPRTRAASASFFCASSAFSSASRASSLRTSISSACRA